MKWIKFWAVIICTLSLAGLFCSCGGKLQYQDTSIHSDSTSEEEEDIAEETEEPTAEASGKAAVRTKGSQENRTFLAGKNKKYKKGTKRTFIVWMDREEYDSEKQEKLWNQIKNMDGFGKGEQVYFWTNDTVRVDQEDLNPDYLLHMEEYSPELYRQIQKDGYYDLRVILYTYPGCDKTILSQTTVAQNFSDDEYVGGSVTDYGEGDTLDAEIVWQLEPEEKSRKYSFKIEKQTMDVDWFWDENVFKVMLSVPYEEYFSLLPNGHEGYPEYYIIKAKKGKESSLRDEINGILGEDGGIYESSYYE